MLAIKKNSEEQFESPLPHEQNPPQERVSHLKEFISANLVPKKFHIWRPPKLIMGKRWYIEYYYRNPATNKFERFRVFLDLNKWKDQSYGNDMRDIVEQALNKGYNPFLEKEFAIPETKKYSIRTAMDFFITEQSGRGLEPDTIARYKYVCSLIETWFASKGLINKPIEDVHTKHLETLLSFYKESQSWSNRQYNNIKGYISIVFGYLKKKNLIDSNPASNITKLKVHTQKHKYYDNKLFPKVTEILKANDTYLWFACQFVYYLGVRSSKELRLMKVGDIIDGGDKFRFRADATKSKRDEIIPIDSNLKEAIIKSGILNSDPSFYIFGLKKVPSTTPVNDDYFSNRFRKIRMLAGLSQDFTIYSLKHTRVVNLLHDGAKLADVSMLLRHRDIATTAIYARALGMDFDMTGIQKLSRKI